MQSIKHLLPQVDRYFKANLHTHSTFSDGNLTPKECKELYESNGHYASTRAFTYEELK